MEIRKTKSGPRFRESITINGRKFNSPFFARKTDCKQWKIDQQSKKFENLLHGDSGKLRDKILFRDYAENWLTSKRVSGLSTSTMDSYERYVQGNISPVIGHLDMKKITKLDIERFQADYRKTHSPKGTNNIMTMLKSIFAEAVKDGYILRSPAQGLKTLTTDNTIEAYWTKPEIDQFLRANAASADYDLYLVALNTGMRKGELAALKWDRIDFSINNGQIAVTRTRDIDGLKETTKTKLKRVIPMNSLVRMTLLKRWQDRKSDFVFTEPDGSPVEVHHLYRRFGRDQKRAGITNKIRFHDLRHTFASQFMMGNGNVFDLQKLLGHTDIKMTMRYAHYSPEHLQSAMNGFELGSLNEVTHFLPTRFEKAVKVETKSEELSG